MTANECPAGYCENEGTNHCVHPVEEPKGYVCCKCEEFIDEGDS